MNISYPARFEPQAEGGFTITFRDIAGAISQAESEDEALYNASEVLSLMLEGFIEDGEPIPHASAPEPNEVLVAPDAATQAAVLIHLAKGQLSTSDLARAMGTSWAAAQRLENPKHSPSLRQLERAAAALGKRLILSLE
jgi:antitoxin HicB